MRSSRVSPMPIRMPVVNGTRQLAGRRASSASRTAGSLSGEPKCAPPGWHSRSAGGLEHHALLTLSSRSAAISSRVITPGLTCGSSRSPRAPARTWRAGSRSCVA